MTTRIPGSLLVALALVTAALGVSPLRGGEVDAPWPRVAGTYTSWLDGAYRYREDTRGVFSALGWPCVRLENVRLADLVQDLDRVDLFFPATLYNYEHAQPFEQYRSEWQRFLERGGVMVALDANYGSQVAWVTQLGESLALQSAQCPAGMKDSTQKVTIVVPGDPFAPPATATVPWAHFAAHGSGWEVLAACPEGHAIALKTRIGRGVLIATNLYSESHYPSAEHLSTLWAAHAPTVMDARFAARVVKGFGGVGRNQVTVHLPAASAPECTVSCDVRRPGAGWETTRVSPVLMAEGGEARFAYACAGGTTELRIAVRNSDGPRWWTSFAVEQDDVLAQAANLAQGLEPGAAATRAAATCQTLARQREVILAECGRLTLLAREALTGDAGEANQARWRETGAQVAALQAQATVLAGRATVAARMAADGEDPAARPFAVVRSEPLAKLHRDESPAGPWRGAVRLECAQAESESIQLAVVPLAQDLEALTVRFEALRGAGDAPLGETVELHRVGYVHVSGPSAGAPAGRSWWPDPLLPVSGPFAARGVCQPVWVDLTVPRAAAPGVYAGTVVVEGAGWAERVPVEVDVLPFELPATHSLRQHFVFRAYLVGQKYFGVGVDDYPKVVPVERLLAMADVCLKRRLGVQIFGAEGSQELTSVVPYLRHTKAPAGWLFDWSEADRVLEHLYASGSRTLFAGFMPGCGGLFGASTRPDYPDFLEAYLREAEAHLRQKGWLAEAVFYMADEAWQEDAVQGNLRLAALMDRAAPNLRRLMTAPKDPRLQGLAHIWVPGGLPEAHPEDAENQGRIRIWREHQAEMWWYICCGPVHPYPNFFVDYPTIDSRMVFWLTWKYGKTGFLYWGVGYHGDPKEMTPDGPSERYSVGPPHMGNGDGTLCYWGPDLTLYPSIRLNAIRDGIEDYEYLALLKRLADAAEAAGRTPELVTEARRLLGVDERVLRLTNGSPNFAYTLDSEALRTARHDLSALITRLSQ